MKARMTLLRFSDKKTIEKEFNWDDFVDTANGSTKVSKISLRQSLIIDNEVYGIIHMLSAREFN